jgi:hypothetical protein
MFIQILQKNTISWIVQHPKKIVLVKKYISLLTQKQGVPLHFEIMIPCF